MTNETAKFGLTAAIVSLLSFLFFTGSPMADEAGKVSAALLERVASEGVVRVLVEVKPSSAEELASAGAASLGLCANADCAKIRVQNMLSESQAKAVESVGEQPYLAMDVTASGLEVLQKSEFVKRIIPDSLSGIEPPAPEDEGAAPAPSSPPDLSAPQD